MKIVIDIDEEDWKDINDIHFIREDLKFKIGKVIMKGKPLPEYHGRLIDADELYGDFIDGTEGYDCNTWNRIEIGDIIEDAPTIIEGSESE